MVRGRLHRASDGWWDQAGDECLRGVGNRGELGPQQVGAARRREPPDFRGQGCQFRDRHRCIGARRPSLRLGLSCLLDDSLRFLRSPTGELYSLQMIL